ncbi:C-Jun-amino-terminal kinase-interacting protein 1-like [Antennarius striatus]|uniref:C-Jun-amino-terminal kinase-interacting protein 1-like n=1 Tax=Antennarius striatus TaxID=241820 RepID=UPI0035B1CC18
MPLGPVLCTLVMAAVASSGSLGLRGSRCPGGSSDDGFWMLLADGDRSSEKCTPRNLVLLTLSTAAPSMVEDLVEHLERRTEEEKRRKEEEARRRREEDVRRRREEEVKRRKEYVARVCKQPKVCSATTSEDGNGVKTGASRSRKFLNLFGNSSNHYVATGAGPFGLFSCVLDGVERQQSHRAVYRFVPRHADELCLETDDPVLMLDQSEDLWCQGYNMRTGAAGIFPAFYAVKVAKDTSKVLKEGWIEQFLVQFLGSVQVPIHKGNDVLCAAMQKVACNRRLAGLPLSTCVLEVSVKGVKISVQDQCHSAHRGDQCFHYFQLKNISFCGCHPKHNKYFGFITKHPDQQRFACHVMMSETTLHPLAESLGCCKRDTAVLGLKTIRRWTICWFNHAADGTPEASWFFR